jgi:2-polyprenyl-3-methyl-5-hydroxy-6-metoxy-1,4-benzoquinol methylase
MNTQTETSVVLQTAMSRNQCRFCGEPLSDIFVDLGMSPLCESYIEDSTLNTVERFYPLRVFVCRKCFLVQLGKYVSPEDIFSDYAYFSSYSDSWLAHVEAYCAMAVKRFSLNAGSRVVELASNDGYLLQYFVKRGIPVLGIEPAANIAKVAVAKGIPTEVRFFGEQAARELVQRYGTADLLLGNNVLAHVPDLNDFVKGMKIMLGEHGVITMEFPHLVKLVDYNQFDTIYHEHFSYFSFSTVTKVFQHHGLDLFDVEQLSTHGGSLRIFAKHASANGQTVSGNVRALLEAENNVGINQMGYYRAFGLQVERTKRSLLSLLIRLKNEGKSIAGYGAPGKGNTLLNYCGIRTDFLDFTVDRNTFKQGKYTPGTHIPIFHPDKIKEAKPDYVLILPWNLKDEIMNQLAFIRTWGGQFIVPIPDAAIVP